MSLGIRKLVVGGALIGVVLLSNALLIAERLARQGWIDWAWSIRSEYLTGTAIVVILASLILVMPSRDASRFRQAWLRRCAVCDHVLLRAGNYCPACGSKV
ncbi:MAG: hypothetical protein AMXMBFR13_06150 [Phycisphaerae bacterium]